MGGASTVLALAKVGDLWRVQIAWPNGTTKHFGKFGSEQEAQQWIGTHGWLTKHIIEDTKISRPWGSVSLAGESRRSIVQPGRPSVAIVRRRTTRTGLTRTVQAPGHHLPLRSAQCASATFLNIWVRRTAKFGRQNPTARGSM